MNIHEFQAKALLKQYGVPTPRGQATTDPDSIRAIADELGGRVVVKAQIHAGGRGKGTFRAADGSPVLVPGGDRPLGGVFVAAAIAVHGAALGRLTRLPQR